MSVFGCWWKGQIGLPTQELHPGDLCSTLTFLTSIMYLSYVTLATAIFSNHGLVALLPKPNQVVLVLNPKYPHVYYTLYNTII